MPHWLGTFTAPQAPRHNTPSPLYRHRPDTRLIPAWSITSYTLAARTHITCEADPAFRRKPQMTAVTMNPSPSRVVFKLRANGGTLSPQQNEVFENFKDSDRQIFPVRAEESSPKGGFASKQCSLHNFGDQPDPRQRSQFEGYRRHTIHRPLHRGRTGIFWLARFHGLRNVSCPPSLILSRFQDETTCARVSAWHDHAGLIHSS